MSSQSFELNCPDCGEKIEERMNFCPICGINLKETTNPATGPTGYQTEIGRLSKYEDFLVRAQEALENDSQLEDALSDCETAIQLNPRAAEAHNLRGLILDLLERKDEAIQSYREAIRLDPTFEEARENLNDAEAEKRGQQFQLIGTDDPEQKKFGWRKLVLLALVLLISAGIFFKSGELLNSIGSIIGPTNTLTFEPDRSKITDVDRAVLEETAQILTDRCDFMGCKSVKFAVSDNGQIVGKIPSYLNLDVETLAGKISAIGLLEFTNFGPTPVPKGTRVTTDFLHPFVLQADEKAWHTIMTNAEIESATVSKDQLGLYVISFTLTETGTQIFAKYTSANVGDYLGIILDKVVLSMPQVGSPITSGQGQITGNFDEESARSLTAYLNINPLPIPLVVMNIGE